MKYSQQFVSNKISILGYEASSPSTVINLLANATTASDPELSEDLWKVPANI